MKKSENEHATPTPAEAIPGKIPSSHHNKVKFMCSHGGKILPRPPDSHLKYVGGETRVIFVYRDVNFSDLMAKITGQFDAEMVLKYQVATLDLDALVSVRSDEDVKHMLDEIDRREKTSGSGKPKFRTFLFPARPTVIENQGHHTGEPHVPEQRYVDAVNGIIRGPPSFPRIPPLKVNRGSFGFWSASASPMTLSPKDNQMDHGPQEGSRKLHMHKVKSSPSLCSLGNGPGSFSSHPIPHRHYHPNSLHPVRLFQHPNRGHMGVASTMSYYYPPSTRYHRETAGGWGMGVNYDEYGTYGGWRHEKAGSVPTSPRKPYWDGPYYRPVTLVSNMEFVK